MKQKRLLFFIIIFVGLLFFWAIWEAFLVCIVPQTKVRFKNIEAFQNKTKHFGLSMTVPLPESQDNLKCYYHVEWFHYLSGFSVSLSDDDYKQFMERCIEESHKGSYELSEYFYLYSEDDVQYAQEDALVKNGITFCNRLLLENEEIEDFYYIAAERIEGTQEYYTCVLANDKNNRIMELSFRNTNPQYDK